MKTKSALIITSVMLLGAVTTAYAGVADNLETDSTISFDFGNGGTPGWYQVDASKGYDSLNGFGFSTTEFNSDVKGSGTNCQSTGIKIDNNHLDEVSFDVDLKPGMYEVCIYAGDIESMIARLEGYPAICNLLYKNAYQQVEIPVSDGQLNISFTNPSGANNPFIISGVTIKRTGDLTSRKKRVFVCSDSLAAEYSPDNISGSLSEKDRGGWGQMLRYYIPVSLYVHNLSVPGETAQGFIDHKQLDSLLHFMQPGDYVLLSFGTNDKSQKYGEQFKYTMGNIIDTVKSAGGIPVVISQMISLEGFASDGSYTYRDDCFAAESGQAADEHNVAFIDIHDRSGWYLTSIGYTQAQKLFWNAWGTRNTVHTNREGAGHIARMIVEGLVDKGFSDFGGTVSGYGISPNIRIKCSTNDNSATVINTTPLSMSYTVSIKGPNSNYAYPVTLPAYDVRIPEMKTLIYENLLDIENEITLSGNGITIQLN